MNINVTLLGEMITFAVLVWVTMKYIWPPIMKVMQEREKTIAAGLEAADRGKKSLELAEKKSKSQLREAKVEATNIVERGNQRAAQMIEEAKAKALEEGKRLLHLAKSDITTEMENARQQLRQQTASLVIDAAEKVLRRNIDAKANAKLIDQVIKEI